MIALVVIVALVIVLCAGYLGVGVFFYRLVLRRYSKNRLNQMRDAQIAKMKNPPPKIPSDEEWQGYMDWLKEREAAGEWLSVTSFDGLNLKAVALTRSEKTDKWAIVVHGFTGAHAEMTPHAEMFWEAGYNVLLPDLRAYGESEGMTVTMGWFDRLDIIEWVKLLVSRNPSSRIVLMGTSMGAATVMMTSGEALPPQVKAVIEDCGYTSVYDEFAHALHTLFHLPVFPSMQAARLVTRVVSLSHFDFYQASALKQVAKSKLPMLFIHGGSDDFVPTAMMEPLYNAKKQGPKEKVLIPGAPHAVSCYVNRPLFVKSAIDFAEKYI
jgi:fermentation-respiration switch protein FrsA (DUF1100 family)